jgi:hypothetical protein
MSKDQALDDLMHGDRESLMESCRQEHEYLGLVNTPDFSKMTYAELANWWVTHMYWDQPAQSWLPKSFLNSDPLWTLHDLQKA